MSRWLPIADWHDPYAEKPAALRRLELFDVYMSKRKAARTRAAKYKVPDLKPLTKSTD